MSRHRQLLWVFAGALLVRLVLLVARSDYVVYDEGYYLLIARNLAGGHGFSPNGLLHVALSPLQPLLVAGLTLAGMPLLWASRLLAAVAGALLVVPVAFLARRWYGERAGLAAALFAAALPARLESLGDGAAAGVFGRQVPRGASPEEAFLAKVNYAGRPRCLTARDLGRAFGPGTMLFSSAFGAIRRAVWEALPFPGIVMSEDQAWALAALGAGHEIRCEPRAAAYHGHRYGFARAFRRNFDSGSSLQRLGLARALGEAPRPGDARR